jgi:hypothetical protein
MSGSVSYQRSRLRCVKTQEMDFLDLYCANHAHTLPVSKYCLIKSIFPSALR